MRACVRLRVHICMCIYLYADPIQDLSVFENSIEQVRLVAAHRQIEPFAFCLEIGEAHIHNHLDILVLVDIIFLQKDGMPI